MKKFLVIVVLTFLFSSNANAGVNEPGSLPISGPCEFAFKVEHQNLKKIYLEKDKKINVVLYASCKAGNFGWGSKKGKNLEALHKQTYKRCLKYAKKHTPGEDCYLYSVNEEVVWKYDKAKILAKKERKAQIDKKPERFFEDQPDVNDDYQIHFNYLLASDSKDREWDINGKMEEILLEMNEKMLKATAGHKYSGGLGKKYKFDFRKDGKLDITFVRLKRSEKKLPKSANNWIVPMLYQNIKMKNPKKIYYNLAEIGGRDGGEAGVPMGTTFLKNKHVKVKRKIILITLHELHHAQGGGFACVPGMGDNGHYSTKREGFQLSTGTRLGPTYIHKVEGCPELVDSVYLTPTSDQPYDPYQVICKKNFGIYNHPKAKIGSNCKWSFLFGN